MQPTELSSVKARLMALASTFAESGAMKGYAPVIDKVFGVFISRMSDEEVRDGLVKFRDEIIPWLLYEPEIIATEAEAGGKPEVTPGNNGFGDNH